MSFRGINTTVIQIRRQVFTEVARMAYANVKGEQANHLMRKIPYTIIPEDEVLLETPLSGTLFTGYTRLYIPVVVSAPGCESGQIVRVKLGRYDGERVRAALC